jgi:hypothetical protein
MLPEITAIESKLKQILYGCVEHVQATKAALYLSSSHDLNQKTYELVTSYQYNAAGREVVTAKDELIDRVIVKRRPFFVNGFATDQGLAEMLFRQGTDRMLIAPLFARGRLVGFIDMRDKAAQKPFGNADIEAASRIADEMLGALSAKNLYGIGPIAIEAMPEASPPAAPAVSPGPKAEAPPRAAGFSRETKQAIEGARQFLSRRQLDRPSGRRGAGEREIELLQLLLPGALALPGAVLAALSAAGQTENPRLVMARATLAEDAVNALQQHVSGVLKRANQPHMISQPPVVQPFGAQLPAVTAGSISAIVSAAVNPESLEGAIVTVAFERTTEEDARNLVQSFLRAIEQPVDAAIASSGGSVDRQAIAEKLLQPDFLRYPELAEHCRSVSVLAQRFARLLELPASQVETVRIAALVHDAGLRLIEYDRLYRASTLTPEEKRVMAEHPIVGAALVEPLLGTDVAQAVLRHHERVDGAGYPSRLRGQQIPLASRIIQIADAWVSMTADGSYQPPVPPEIAADRLREGAGTQFDSKLVDAFLKSLSELAG